MSELKKSVTSKSKTVCIPRKQYKILKRKAEVNERLLESLVRGLEDIRLGKIKPWKKTSF